MQDNGISENSTVITFLITEKSKTLHRKEILLADFTTLLADCGSYLGLFLGASILSISELVLTLTKRMLLYWIKKLKGVKETE